MINPTSLQSELNRMLSIREKIENVLKKAPEGTLFYQQQSNHPPVPYAAYRRNGKRIRRSLKKADPKHVRALLFKKYAKKLLPIVDQNILSMKSALRYTPLSELTGSLQEDFYKPCKDYFLGKPPTNADFDRLPERQNPSHPEELNVNTELGVFRTREEYLTARAMNLLGLTFKYETPLPVGTHCRYPDFAVLHPKTGEIVYIEYAGKQHDPEYRKGLLRRIDEYANAGVYLGANLFVIAPSPGGGYDMEAVIDQLKGIFGI
ncbi:MAG: hypothetical protein II907_00390 [Firmicutes bacterium]|nr:hypothetical protein [Bacillota bacterium]